MHIFTWAVCEHGELITHTASLNLHLDEIKTSRIRDYPQVCLAAGITDWKLSSPACVLVRHVWDFGHGGLFHSGCVITAPSLEDMLYIFNKYTKDQPAGVAGNEKFISS